MSDDTEIVINNTENMPKHVAIIMDGNGRWAKNRGKIRTFGHENAIKSVRTAIEFCRDYKIPYLTLYAFSTENWNRPISEVSILLRLLSSSIKKETDKFINGDIRVLVIGNKAKFPTNLQNELKGIEEKTKNNKSFTLLLALNYGAKEEILRATRKIAEEVKNKRMSLEEINEESFGDHLYTQGIPNVDLMIRTSGEQRLSNFLLWQLAYAELYFTDVLWPDFSREEFLKAIDYYNMKERRFGKISEQLIKKR